MRASAAPVKRSSCVTSGPEAVRQRGWEHPVGAEIELGEHEAVEGAVEPVDREHVTDVERHVVAGLDDAVAGEGAEGVVLGGVEVDRGVRERGRVVLVEAHLLAELEHVRCAGLAHPAQAQPRAVQVAVVDLEGAYDERRIGRREHHEPVLALDHGVLHRRRCHRPRMAPRLARAHGANERSCAAQASPYASSTSTTRQPSGSSTVTERPSQYGFSGSTSGWPAAASRAATASTLARSGR